ncbi:MAG: hypothetical protein KF749_11790 [Bacteroidetes bacterium]|nr:hypothetical protein [Bacteroidota bacterium]MCW5894545.1 hypothetical protein [Bacteroidota bacterium]
MTAENRRNVLHEQWGIGIYRLRYSDGQFVLTEDKAASNPVLTAKSVGDRRTGFAADPFLIYENGIYYMFFEVFKKHRGSIGFAVSKNGRKWKFRQVVLEEPFHLSYPFVFKWNGKWFMMPEAFETKSIRLYEATRFPDTWAFVKTLSMGREYVDPTLLHVGGRLWLFVSETTNGNLYLLHSDSLEGDWQEHPQSPVIKDDPSCARPGGGIIQMNNRLIRIAQDCSKTYGGAARAFEITELTTTAYSEKELPESPLLTASGKGWNRDGMHHVSLLPVGDSTWIAAVDGKMMNAPAT